MQIKMCGITRLEDALVAANLGVDAIGFIFSQTSPRFMIPTAVRRIAVNLPRNVRKVGVFVNSSFQDILETIEIAAIDTIQLHGSEDTKFISELRRFTRLPVIKAVALNEYTDFLAIQAFSRIATILFDSQRDGQSGGTGVLIDSLMAKSARISLTQNFILAGGLRPSNVGETIRAVRPIAVDVSSGIEDEPGIKNHYKMASFVQEVRNTAC